MLVLVTYDVNTLEEGGKKRLRRVGEIKAAFYKATLAFTFVPFKIHGAV